ncbi:hypothetical protein AMTRI_Chr08g207180 [Amborella trichopoda]
MKQLHEQASRNHTRDEEGTRNPMLFNTINNQRDSLSSTTRKMFDTMPKRDIVSWISLISSFDHVFMHHDTWMIIPWAYRHPQRIVRAHLVMSVWTIWTHLGHRWCTFRPARIVMTYLVMPVGTIWTHPGCL